MIKTTKTSLRSRVSPSAATVLMLNFSLLATSFLLASTEIVAQQHDQDPTYLDALEDSEGRDIDTGSSSISQLTDLRNLVIDSTPTLVTKGQDGIIVQELTALPGLSGRDSGDDLHSFTRTQVSSDNDTSSLNIPLSGLELETDFANTDESLLDEAKRQVEAITSARDLANDLEVKDGPFSPQLPERLSALSQLLIQQGEFNEAKKLLDQAIHISRVNYGLYTPRQIPYIKIIISNFLADGDLLSATERQLYLFNLQQRAFKNNLDELLPAIYDFADWNIRAFNASLWNPSLAFDNTQTQISNDEALFFRVQRLVNALTVYWSMRHIITSNLGDNFDQIDELDKRIALTNYLYEVIVGREDESISMRLSNEVGNIAAARDASLPSLGSLGYRQGRDALERRKDHILQNPDSSIAQKLGSELDLADWLLYFGRQRMLALNYYNEIEAKYKDLLSNELYEQIFHPSYPVQLPSFIAREYSRAALGIPATRVISHDGYFDVEIKLNRFGRASHIEILQHHLTSAPDSQTDWIQQQPQATIASRLERMLRNSQFRPRFSSSTQHENSGDNFAVSAEEEKDYKLTKSDIFTARFYYSI